MVLLHSLRPQDALWQGVAAVAHSTDSVRTLQLYGSPPGPQCPHIPGSQQELW